MSIDDVTHPLKTTKMVEEMYQCYDIFFHCYVFYKFPGGGVLSFDQEEYTHLLRSMWIDWGVHDEKYVLETERVLGQLPRSRWLRLHNFYASEQTMIQLSQIGIAGMLCADILGRYSYQLTKDDIDMLQHKGTITKERMSYIKTDLRLEKSFVWQLLRRRHRNEVLTVFTHEDKLEFMLSRMRVLFSVLNKYNIRSI